jgi:hypothetical protein
LVPTIDGVFFRIRDTIPSGLPVLAEIGHSQIRR